MTVRHKKDYLIHPYKIFLALVIGGITAAFLGMSIAYLYSRIQNGGNAIQLPVLFYLNAFILLGCSYAFILAKRAFQRDNTIIYKRQLILTIGLTLLFLFLQFIAWKQLQVMSIPLQHSTTASYLYVISGLHLLHVIAGLPFLFHFYWKAHLDFKDPVRTLIYFSDPDRKMKLNLLTIYWHFLDALWLYLLLFFAINYWI